MRSVKRSYLDSRVETDVKEASEALGRVILLVSARRKRREGESEPSMCRWCSHFGISWRNWWWLDLHILNRFLGLDRVVGNVGGVWI